MTDAVKVLRGATAFYGRQTHQQGEAQRGEADLFASSLRLTLLTFLFAPGERVHAKRPKGTAHGCAV
ncbi:protein of unknown function [Methylocaldum szegediense]|uniref:Uncharacterized protein n=1 Tax=Methylocaldum szegediense TaxID=73780 RepID=A0ABM9I0Q7_9GAMM|nr:protein of unknown function [Methylocaldum szegediense]